MKGGLAMMLAALLRARAADEPCAGDLLFAALADEEAGGTYGARFLVERHPELFAGIRHAVGEFGGFPLHFGGRTVYPVQIAEKTPCLATVTVSGRGGHGARVTRGEGMARLAQLLRRLDRGRFPARIPHATEQMVRGLAAATRGPTRWLLRSLLRPPWTDWLLRLFGRRLELLEPLFRDTATPTVVRAGEKANIVPSEISAVLDCRLLPGSSPEAFLEALRRLVGSEPRIELDCLGEAPDAIDLALYPLLTEILADVGNGAVAVPLLLPASTDARFFARLGIQSYGFLPMDLPASFPFFDRIHAVDERLPLRSLEFGTRCMLELIRRYPGSAQGGESTARGGGR
jgi:acetylornithine deacetylase/succinyl-diaminopimelate desuccinylase-like protein